MVLNSKGGDLSVLSNKKHRHVRFKVLGRVYISFAFPRCAQMPVFSRCCEICLLKRRQENGEREMEETQKSLLLVGLSGRERKKRLTSGINALIQRLNYLYRPACPHLCSNQSK